MVIDANRLFDLDRRLNIQAKTQEPLYVEAEKTKKIFEVLMNLLTNAIKFTTEGSITVRARKVDNYVQIEVKDIGKGIDSDIMPRLFTKFAAKSDQGTGLGLFISKSIVEAHGGRIWAANNKDGMGASFIFTLPIDNASNKLFQ